MNKQDTLRNLLIASIVFVLLMAVGNFFLQPQHRPEASTPMAGEPGSAMPDETTDARRETSAERPSDRRREPATADTSQVFTVSEAEEEQTVSLGSAPANGIETNPEESPYRMRLLLSNVGASIDSATMTDHAEELRSPNRYQLLKPMERPDGAITRSLAVEKIQIDGFGVRLSDKKWHVALAGESRAGPAEVRFWIDVEKAGRGVVRVTHTFSLPKQDRKLGRHDLRSDISIENLSDEPHRVLIAYRGGLGIRRINPRFPDEFVDWGVWDGQRVHGNRKDHAAISKSGGQLVLLYRPTPHDPKARLSWAATANTYFTCTIAPLDRDGTDSAGYLADVSALDVDGLPTTHEDVTLQFVTTTEVLQAGQTLDYPAAVYIGEKDGNAFREITEYRDRNYYFQISKGFGICTFTWLVEMMIWLINSLTWVTHDFGIAIIILVLIVRTLLHPITKKGQVNMVRMQHKMQTLAPKIEEIKKKYANDKALMNQEMMKLNINPAGQMITCLPMMIQMPIWVALYISLSNNILMRHEPFLFTWINDLTAQDALYTFKTPIHVPLFGWELTAFNLLPVLVAVFMYTQQKLQPKPKPNPNATDQQRQQQEMMQKMMPMMSIMMLLIFYNMPSGLNLYIMSSSLFGTIEQWRIRAHIKEREEDGTLHQPTKKANKSAASSKPRKPGFFAKLQKMAEEAQKDKLRRYGKTKKGR